MPVTLVALAALALGQLVQSERGEAGEALAVRRLPALEAALPDAVQAEHAEQLVAPVQTDADRSRTLARQLLALLHEPGLEWCLAAVEHLDPIGRDQLDECALDGDPGCTRPHPADALGLHPVVLVGRPENGGVRADEAAGALADHRDQLVARELRPAVDQLVGIGDEGACPGPLMRVLFAEPCRKARHESDHPRPAVGRYRTME
jgi:hypothetical protein